MVACRRLAGAICLAAAPASAHIGIALGHARLAVEGLTSLQLAGIFCLLLDKSRSDDGQGLHKRRAYARLWLVPATLLWLAAARVPAPLVLLLDAALFHAVIQASLLLLFAGSLRPDHEPLVTMMARRIHGTLRPDIAVYTRRATLAWSVFFALQLGVSASLLSASLTGWLPVRWWWIVVPDSCLPATIAMFVMEHVVRRRLITGFQHVGFRVAISAFRNRAGGVS